MTLYKWGKFKVHETYEKGPYKCRSFFYAKKNAPMYKDIPFKFRDKSDLENFLL